MRREDPLSTPDATPVSDVTCVTSAYLNEGCQHSQAVWFTLRSVVALIFRIVVNNVNLWEQERVSQGWSLQTS